MRTLTDPIPLLLELIALPSVNPAASDDLDPALVGEGRVVAYLAELYRAMGLEPFFQPTGKEGRENVGALLAVDPALPTLLLQAHTDTVGVGGARELLRPVVREGRVYGRGACDDKGGLAAMLAALALATQRRAELTHNVIMMGVADEEICGSGAQALVAQEPSRGATYAVVSEPTDSLLVNGGKGVARWTLDVHGVSAHSSEPQRGVNAIYRMAYVLQAIEAYQERLAGFVDAVLGPERVSVGLISGGTSVNVVPDRCRIAIDRRLTRQFSPEGAQADLRAFLCTRGLEAECHFSPLASALNAALVEADSPVVALAQGVCARRGLDTALHQVAYGSDALRMVAAGMPTLLWGPGSITVAHTTSEYIEIADVLAARDFYFDLMCG